MFLSVTLHAFILCVLIGLNFVLNFKEITQRVVRNFLILLVIIYYHNIRKHLLNRIPIRLH